MKDFAFRHHDPDAKLALLARLWFFGILISRGPIRGAARAFQLASPDARREALGDMARGPVADRSCSVSSARPAQPLTHTDRDGLFRHGRLGVRHLRGRGADPPSRVRSRDSRHHRGGARRGGARDARAFRRELSKSSKYNRKFEKDQESAEAMETAGIGMVSKGASARVTVREAISFGATCEIAPHRTSARPTTFHRRAAPRSRAEPRDRSLTAPPLPTSARSFIHAGGLVSQMRSEGFEHVNGMSP